MGLPERDIAQAAGFIAPPGYRRHRPEATLLYQIVAEHYPRASAAASVLQTFDGGRFVLL